MVRFTTVCKSTLTGEWVLMRLAGSHPCPVSSSIRGNEPRALFTERNWKPMTQNQLSTAPWEYNGMSDRQCTSRLGTGRPVRGILSLKLPQGAARVPGSVKAWGWKEWKRSSGCLGSQTSLPLASPAVTGGGAGWPLL